MNLPDEETSGHTPGLLRDPLLKRANLLRNQGSSRDNEMVLTSENLLRKKDAGGRAAPGAAPPGRLYSRERTETEQQNSIARA